MSRPFNIPIKVLEQIQEVIDAVGTELAQSEDDGFREKFALAAIQSLTFADVSLRVASSGDLSIEQRKAVVANAAQGLCMIVQTLPSLYDEVVKQERKKE